VTSREPSPWLGSIRLPQPHATFPRRKFKNTALCRHLPVRHAATREGDMLKHGHHTLAFARRFGSVRFAWFALVRLAERASTDRRVHILESQLLRVFGFGNCCGKGGCAENRGRSQALTSLDFAQLPPTPRSYLRGVGNAKVLADNSAYSGIITP
jgi:hypothetical protein